MTVFDLGRDIAKLVSSIISIELYKHTCYFDRFEHGTFSVSTGLIGTSLFRVVSSFNTHVSVPLNVCGYTVKKMKRRKQAKTGPAQIPLFKKSFGGRLWSGRVYGSLLPRCT